MFGNAKLPLDRFPYARSPDSRRLSLIEAVGRYAFVVDIGEVIHVAPDAAHVHPKVLGNASPALQAGELHIDRVGHVAELTNCSGTFQFKGKRSLCCVASLLVQSGFSVGDVLWFPPDGSTGPVLLVCPGGTVE